MKKFLTCYFFLSMLCASSIALAQGVVQITGNVTNSPSTTVLLQKIGSDISDSSKVDDKGNFTFTSKINASDYYRLVFDNNRYVLLVLGVGDKLEISVDYNKLNSPNIKGSASSQLLYETFNTLDSYDIKLDQYKKKIEEEKKKYIVELIKNNPSSLVNIMFLEQINVEENLPIVKNAVEQMMKQHPDNKWVKEVNNKINGLASLGPGTEAPEINLPNPDGKNIALSSLRGKVVLIDFWASWCGPCRAESPNMVKLYNKFKSKGFEIYSVSLDKDKAPWLKAIKDDKLDWTHVSELKFWESQVVSLYKFDGIPFTVLIDKNGKIIAKGLRGDAIDSKLTEILGK